MFVKIFVQVSRKDGQTPVGETNPNPRQSLVTTKTLSLSIFLHYCIYITNLIFKKLPKVLIITHNSNNINLKNEKVMIIISI